MNIGSAGWRGSGAGGRSGGGSGSRRLPWLLRAWFLVAACAAFAAVAAQPAAPVAADAPPSDEAVLASVRQKLDAIQKALRGPVQTIDMVGLRTSAIGAQADADATTGRLEPLFTSVQARLTELGTPAPGKQEPPDIAAQRAQLDRSRGTYDAQIKLSKLLSVEAGQAADQIWTLRRSQFQARLGERTDTILGKAFWIELRSNVPADARHAESLGHELAAAARAAPVRVWLEVVLGVTLVVAARVAAGRWLRSITMRKVPPGRLRRSVHALATTLLSAVPPGVVAWLLVTAIDWDESVSSATEALLGSAVAVICFAGFVAGLGQALLAADKPSWRLPAIPDAAALRIRWFPATIAVASVLSWLSDRLPVALNASLETAVAAKYIVSLTIGVVIALGLMRIEHQRRLALLDPEQARGAIRPLWVSVVAVVVWLALGVSLACLLLGYVALGSFIVQQMIWVQVVYATGYLLVVLVDDVCTVLAAPRARDDMPGAPVVPPVPTLRLQAAVLLSGAIRLVIGAVALTLVVAQFGAGPDELFRRIGQVFDSVAIGEVQVRPASVLQAIAVLVLGLTGVRLLKRWLADRYLPTTTLDPGMRMSAMTLFGYAGGVTVVAMSLTAVGIGLERVAWVASALSVGIGFGLQAVVQNFVSGLILLAERPVKVGDWVSLGGVEGDIRRINVRATEIEMGDKSTVIVPNSEFITKTVRNVTHANPLGLVQIKLPMPLDTDVQKVQGLLLSAFNEHPDVLADPAPAVALDGIENSTVVFNATGFVSSPRATYNVRSSLLMTILKEVRGAGLAMSKPPTMLLGTPAPTALSVPQPPAPAVTASTS